MNNDELQNTTADIREVCNQVADMLVKKNQSYGDSALTPAHIFSRLDSIEGLKIRIDDKLNRLRLGNGDHFQEDVELDLMGYLVLLRIARKRAKEWELRAVGAPIPNDEPIGRTLPIPGGISKEQWHGTSGKK